MKVKVNKHKAVKDTWEPVDIVPVDIVDVKVSDPVPEPETVSDSNPNGGTDNNSRPDFIFKINMEYYNNKTGKRSAMRAATDYFRKYVHGKLVGNSDYINSAIVLSDSLQYPEVFDDRKDGTETVEVVVGPESNTDINFINRIIREATKTTQDEFPNIICNFSISCDKSKINIVYPTNDLLTQSACIGFGRLVTMSYQTRNNKSVDDHTRGECFKRIYDTIKYAYVCGHNVIIIPNGFIRITDKKDNPYSDKKIDFLANFIMAAVFMNGGDFDYIPETLYVPDINEKEKQSWNNGWRF